MKRLAIIGGSGFTSFDVMEVERQETVSTPFGEPSAPLVFGRFADVPVVFLPRHGTEHHLPPHRVNYRANIWALHHIGVELVIGVAAVGGITQPPGTICIPDQVIDYTWGRDGTFCDADSDNVVHVDFTEPYCDGARRALVAAAQKIGKEVETQGTYGATQGPRLESAAEIRRMARDGCDLVGMTGMPETVLAREKALCYACCAVVVNWAAGKTAGPITMEDIDAKLASSIDEVRKLLAAITL